MNYSDRAGSTATERFMKHYFLIARDVGDLTRIFITMLEEKGRRRPLMRISAALRRRKVGRRKIRIRPPRHRIRGQDQAFERPFIDQGVDDSR